MYRKRERAREGGKQKERWKEKQWLRRGESERDRRKEEVRLTCDPPVCLFHKFPLNDWSQSQHSPNINTITTEGRGGGEGENVLHICLSVDNICKRTMQLNDRNNSQPTLPPTLQQQHV